VYRRTYDLRRLASLQTTEEDEDHCPFVSAAVRSEGSHARRRSTTELSFGLFDDSLADLVGHFAVVDRLGRNERNRRGRNGLHRVIGVFRSFISLDRLDGVLTSVENRVVADKQRGIPCHGGQSLRLGAIKSVTGDGSRNRHHFGFDHQGHRIRASSDESEDDVAGASVEQRECL